MAENKSIFWAGMVFAVLLIGGFFLNSGSSLEQGISGRITGATVSEGLIKNSISGDVQVVKMRVEGSEYIFEPLSVKKGTPVRLEADVSKMPGCSKSVISSELGIRKTFTLTDNSVQFTPNKAGAFYIACSMNMYKGTLTVLESDGSKADYVQASASGAMACSSSGSGCGCGGA